MGLYYDYFICSEEKQKDEKIIIVDNKQFYIIERFDEYMDILDIDIPDEIYRKRKEEREKRIKYLFDTYKVNKLYLIEKLFSSLDNIVFYHIRNVYEK